MAASLGASNLPCAFTSSAPRSYQRAQLGPAAQLQAVKARRTECHAVAIDRAELGQGSPEAEAMSFNHHSRRAVSPQQTAQPTSRQPAQTRTRIRQHQQHQQHRNQSQSQNSAEKTIEDLAAAYLGQRSRVWTIRTQSRPVPPAAWAVHVSKADTDQGHMVCKLAQQDKFPEAISLIQNLAEKDKAALARVSHRYFMWYVTVHKQPQQGLAFLKALPSSLNWHFRPTYNLALKACADCHDLATANAIMDLAHRTGLEPDVMLLTTYISVCKSVGAADKAFATWLDIKKRGLTPDAHAVGALVAAFAQAMSAEVHVAHERKEKFLLLEKALGVVQQAQQSGLKLSVECYNSLIVCAGRCGQLNRALGMLETLQLQGLRTDAYTYGALMEACMASQRPDLALRLFNQAHQEGHTQSIQLYTHATTACQSLGGRADWEYAMQLYNLMQRYDVKPDTKYYAALISVAGLSGHLPQAFQLLEDMVAEDLRPDGAVCSALIRACGDGHHSTARRVYDCFAAQNIFPDISQYNRMMDWCSEERRFGDVVSLLTDMTQRAGLQPNLNTFRVLLNACQRSDQVALALEVFAVMKANKVPILQEKFAHALYYSLIKGCLNMQRHLLSEHNPQPAPWASGSTAGRPAVRLPEARQVLLALGSSLEARGPSCLLLQDPDAVTWAQYAVSCYKDMLARGWRPTLTILDKLMSCLRLPGSVVLQHTLLTHSLASRIPNGQSSHVSPNSLAMALRHEQSLSNVGTNTSPDDIDHVRARLLQQMRYQVAFENRAVELVADAISRGYLPAFTVDQACNIDLTPMPPSLAEVYVIALLTALERRAARAWSHNREVGPGSDGHVFFHRLALKIPSFDQDYVLWPSYVPKLSLREEETGISSVEQSPEPAELNGMHHDIDNTHDALNRLQEQLNHSISSTEDMIGLAGASSMDHTSQPGVTQAQQAQPSLSGIRRRAKSVANNDSATDFRASSQSLDSDADDMDNVDRHSQPREGPLDDSLQGAILAAEDPADMDTANTMYGSPATGLAVAATLRRMKFNARIEASTGVIYLDPPRIAEWVRTKRNSENRLQNQQGIPQQQIPLQPSLPSKQHIPVHTGLPSHSIDHHEESHSLSLPNGLPHHLAGAGALRVRSPAEQQRRIRLGMQPALPPHLRLPHQTPLRTLVFPQDAQTGSPADTGMTQAFPTAPAAS